MIGATLILTSSQPNKSDQSSLPRHTSRSSKRGQSRRRSEASRPIQFSRPGSFRRPVRPIQTRGPSQSRRPIHSRKTSLSILHIHPSQSNLSWVWGGLTLTAKRSIMPSRPNRSCRSSLPGVLVILGSLGSLVFPLGLVRIFCQPSSATAVNLGRQAVLDILVRLGALVILARRVIQGGLVIRGRLAILVSLVILFSIFWRVDLACVGFQGRQAILESQRHLASLRSLDLVVLVGLLSLVSLVSLIS